jgi:hypothetical protein
VVRALEHFELFSIVSLKQERCRKAQIAVQGRRREAFKVEEPVSVRVMIWIVKILLYLIF